ncbi:PREDICTED: uncharacterized protein LOC109478486 [Branchiostoma belcheri]|uniref:Uncharacterized protein LOC109478486 n=1 Tax=Branchiostoma belcheri TaxID=7741 RepID=A0A6P4Z224_BRABE|nr:PREDICTED: uncharacterized protein LOC109478486 [Branchiostoma belcheri]
MFTRTMAYQLAPLLTSVLLVTLSGAYAEDPAADLRRMAVITSLIPAVPPSANRGAWASSEAVNFTAAFRATENGTLQLSVGILDNVTREEMFSEWVDLGSPSSSVKVVSNPSATYTVNKTIQVFVQCSDGQVYYLEQMPKHAVYFVTWYSLPGSLPVDRAAWLVGRDSVSALMWKGKVAVFVRSMQVASHLYWCTGVARSFTPWQDLGGNLATDATVVYNPFSGYMEAYAVLSDGKVNRKDQVHNDKWQDWTVLGFSQPDMVNTSRPAAHAMSETIFHGMTEVFALGADGKIKHIWQTTCDKVVNPWGYCTWGLWGNIAGSLSNNIPAVYGHAMDRPQPRGQVNVLAPGHNVHLGNEVFFVGKNGSLWHVWQLLRDDIWNGPNLIGRPDEGEIASLPTITQDKTGGWWKAYVITTEWNVGIVAQQKNLSLSVERMASGSNLTVSWHVPADEAAGADWIGVYRQGDSENRNYLDFRYVQGGQNPKQPPVPKGSVTMAMYLPDGKYNLRYLVNRKFSDVITTGVDVYGGPQDENWVQLYQGMAIGLGKEGLNITLCVKDGEDTVKKFEQAWEAFLQREFWEGLKLLGVALDDLVIALVQCEETAIGEALRKFVKDLLNCATAQHCTSFVVDLVEETEIWFKDSYEIFGDIRAASNNFRLLKAYKQGGVCVGRVVKACINVDSNITKALVY